jgi:hypothetical protein
MSSLPQIGIFGRHGNLKLTNFYYMNWYNFHFVLGLTRLCFKVINSISESFNLLRPSGNYMNHLL